MLKAGYICQKCGMDVFDVLIRERKPNEHIQNYVHHTGRICGENHAIRSPMCRAVALDIKLPISSNGIGFDGNNLNQREIADLNRQIEEKKQGRPRDE